MNELLQHPTVVAHVQRYLDSLGAVGPNGWSTWRMKLPPQMLAQMATVIAQSRWGGTARGHPSSRLTLVQLAAPSPKPCTAVKHLLRRGPPKPTTTELPNCPRANPAACKQAACPRPPERRASQEAAHAAVHAHGGYGGGHGGREQLLPQTVEDNMSGTQLIEGFSLQELLHDMPNPGGAGPAHLPVSGWTGTCHGQATVARGCCG